MFANNSTPKSFICGCAGVVLTDEERRFFAKHNPLGFILFARNVDNPKQVRSLVESLRETVGRENAPILIDQEGGRVQRLQPPHWRKAPPASVFSNMKNTNDAIEAVRINSRLIAYELAELGINVDCLPLLDVRFKGANDIIGDRSFGYNPEIVAKLGKASCDGLLDGGVLPVIKHIPGHGRAMADSHLKLPIVNASRKEL
ncbi:MAG: glycoside hydrolase family 3 protein, partial [Alphaproteobacteria bacterium]|nr:glycoside hydrolase family 3 protein [Alphaproteobacteria bacterium]